MKKIILLIFIPFISFSQQIAISGSVLWDVLDKINLPPAINSIATGSNVYTVDERQLSNYFGVEFRTPPTAATLVIGAEYIDLENYFIDGQGNIEVSSFGETSGAIMPNVEIQFRAFHLGNYWNPWFRCYASIGSNAILESLNFVKANSSPEFSHYEYNALMPFLRAGWYLSLNNWGFNINYFISYEIEPIYFENFDEIGPIDIPAALRGAQVVTGLKFSKVFGGGY